MKSILTVILICNFIFCFSQEDEESEAISPNKTELGLDCFANASTLGGAFGLGLKYGVIKNENIIFGPSARLQRFWSNNGGQKYGFTIYGGGAFVHYRLNNKLFAGAEFEVLRSPFQFNNLFSPKRWVSTCFLGGGFSHEFENIGFRLNAGIFYDIIANPSSPFATSYFLRRENGSLLPVIYRIGFFFPLS